MTRLTGEGFRSTAPFPGATVRLPERMKMRLDSDHRHMKARLLGRNHDTIVERQDCQVMTSSQTNLYTLQLRILLSTSTKITLKRSHDRYTTVSSSLTDEPTLHSQHEDRRQSENHYADR